MSPPPARLCCISGDGREGLRDPGGATGLRAGFADLDQQSAESLVGVGKELRPVLPGKLVRRLRVLAMLVRVPDEGGKLGGDLQRVHTNPPCYFMGPRWNK